MTIRRALDGDRPLLLDLWERSVRVTHAFLSASDIATLKPLVATALTSDALEWWVAATEADEPMAFLGYSPATIDALFVDPRYRGRGVGTRLVAHAQHLAVGALRVDVNEQNEAARGFYASLGFEAVGRSPTDDGGRPFPIIHMTRPAPVETRVTSSDISQRAFLVFDATYFRKSLVTHADASGAGATVEVHLVNGHAHRVRSLVEVTDGYVVLEVYQRRPEMSGMQTPWRGSASPAAAPNEIHHAVITYESIAALLITPVEDKASSRIGFKRPD